MGMSTHVIGFVPPDERWRKMKEVWDSCTNAGIAVPEVVNKFFNYEDPDEAGVEIDIKGATKKWTDDCRSGIEVDLSVVPKHVTTIRFYNSF